MEGVSVKALYYVYIICNSRCRILYYHVSTMNCNIWMHRNDWSLLDLLGRLFAHSIRIRHLLQHFHLSNNAYLISTCSYWITFYSQSVTPHLSLGGEVFWAGQHRKSGLGYAARYNTDKMVFCILCVLSGLNSQLELALMSAIFAIKTSNLLPLANFKRDTFLLGPHLWQYCPSFLLRIKMGHMLMNVEGNDVLSTCFLI